MALKQDINYFEVFNRMADCTKLAAEKLLDMLRNYTDVAAKADAVHDVEHSCDGLFHEMRTELNRAFITPIDREDIMQIADGIDSITDAIEDVANLFDMLSISAVLPEAVTMAELIVRATDALAVAVKEFQQYKNSKKLGSLLIEVNHLEEEGDRLHRGVIKALYRNASLDVLTIVKWKEIFDMEESVLDACEDVADMLEGLAIKNG